MLINACLFNAQLLYGSSDLNQREILRSVNGSTTVKQMQSYINAGFNINTTDDRGATAFIYAIHLRNRSLAHYLLDQKANFNIKDSKGEKALHHSAYASETKITRRLIKLGANVNDRDDCGLTPVMHAIKGAFFDDIIRNILSVGYNFNIVDDRGFTALAYAMSHEKYDLAKFFVEKCGANPNVNTFAIESVLHTAIEKDAPIKLIKALIANNANVNERSRIGNFSLLSLIIHKQKNDLIPLFLRCDSFNINLTDYAGRTHLMGAVINRNVEAVRLLLQDPRIEVNHAASGHGITALMYAVIDGTPDILRMLLAPSSILFYVVNDLYCDFLHYVAISENPDFLDVVLEVKDIIFDDLHSTRMNGGFLTIYIEDNKIGQVGKLLKHPNINVNLEKYGLLSPIKCAIKFGRFEIIKMLFDYEPQFPQWCNRFYYPLQMNIVSLYDDLTPLMYAASNNKLQAVRLLLTHPEINIRVKDSNQQTAKDMATDPLIIGELRFHSLKPFLSFIEGSQIQNSMVHAYLGAGENTTQVIAASDLTRFLCEYID